MIIYGDVNGDGRITIEDLVIVKAHIEGVLQLQGNALKAADVNSDGVVDNTDVAWIKYHIRGRTTINKVEY